MSIPRECQLKGLRGRSSRALRLGLAILFVALGLCHAVYSQNPADTAKPVYLVDIDGAIHPGAAGLLDHAITTAAEAQAAALIVRIDTPGGMLSTTRDMVSAIAESPVPVIGYIGPAGASATSAGAFILLATDIAVMNRGTNVGASSPVSGDGGDIEGTMGKKVMNDSRAFMRSIASSRNRNADAAELFVSEAQSFTALEALDENVINLVVEEFTNLLPALNGREIRFHGEALTLHFAEQSPIPVKPRLIDRFLQYVAHPQIAHLLISLGMLAIYIEILSPGLAFPGIFGAVALILGMVGIQTLPVNIGFLLLLFLGVTLMMAEYFVAGFGVLGIGGAIAFTIGSLNLFDLPNTAEYQDGILSVSLAVCGAIVVTSVLITRSVFFAGGKQKNLVGKTGEAMVTFDTKGFVLVNEQRWPADTEEPLHHGDPIVVVSHIHSDRLVVKKAEFAAAPDRSHPRD